MRCVRITRASRASRIARASRSEEGGAAPEPASASDLAAARTLVLAEPPLPDEDDEEAASAPPSSASLVPIGVVDYYDRSLFSSSALDDSIRSRKIRAVLKLDTKPTQGKGVKLVDDEDGFERVLSKNAGNFLRSMSVHFIPHASIGEQSPLSEEERALFESDSNKEWVKDMVKRWKGLKEKEKKRAPRDRRPVEVRALEWVTREEEIPTTKTNASLLNSLKSFIDKTDSLPATWVGNEKLELHFDAVKCGCTVASLEKWDKLAQLTNWPSGGHELAGFAKSVKVGNIPFPSNPSHPIHAAPFLDAATIAGIKKKNEEKNEKKRKRRREPASATGGSSGAASSSADGGAASG